MSIPLSYSSPETQPRRSRKIGCFIAIGVLALVLGAAVWIVDGMLIRFTITVVIDNRSSAAIPEVGFNLGGERFRFVDIASGTTMKWDVALRRSGELDYILTRRNGSRSSGVACSHLDADCRGYHVGLLIREDTEETFWPR